MTFQELSWSVPGNDWRGHGSVSYGNYDAVSVEAGLSGPIVTEKLFFGVAGLYNKREGYFDNLVTHNDFSGNANGAIDKLLINPTTYILQNLGDDLPAS